MKYYLKKKKIGIAAKPKGIAIAKTQVPINLTKGVYFG